MKPNNHSVLNAMVIVAALGYFVDIFDLLLFIVVKNPSLRDVGSTDLTILADSTRILNWQMSGLLIGGIIWGMMGDKRGRLSVLFGSILLYSVANFLTAYVQTVDQYVICRFVTGLGLAGELGAGITLVSELLPKEKRGIGTSLVAGIGLSGVVTSYFVFQFTGEDWRLCYKIGGVMGILLLFMRMSVMESQMFRKMKTMPSLRGNFFMFFSNRSRFKKYMMAILIGLPNWYAMGVLVNQSDRFATQMYGANNIETGKAIMYAYIAVCVGDLLAGFVSQWLRSRKKALFLYYLLTVASLILYFSPFNDSDGRMYLFCTMLGLSTGYWAIIITMGAEQFGTDLRATAATTIPNMIRGSLVPINLLFLNVFQLLWGWNVYYAGAATGIVIMIITFFAFYFTEETYHKDLDYEEFSQPIP